MLQLQQSSLKQRALLSEHFYGLTVKGAHTCKLCIIGLFLILQNASTLYICKYCTNNLHLTTLPKTELYVNEYKFNNKFDSLFTFNIERSTKNVESITYNTRERLIGKILLPIHSYF